MGDIGPSLLWPPPRWLGYLRGPRPGAQAAQEARLGSGRGHWLQWCDDHRSEDALCPGKRPGWRDDLGGRPGLPLGASRAREGHTQEDLSHRQRLPAAGDYSRDQGQWPIEDAHWWMAAGEIRQWP